MEEKFANMDFFLYLCSSKRFSYGLIHSKQCFERKAKHKSLHRLNRNTK